MDYFNLPSEFIRPLLNLQVNKTYKIEACEGYQCMKENNVEEYHLEEEMEDTCRGVIFLKPTNCTYIINRALS